MPPYKKHDSVTIPLPDISPKCSVLTLTPTSLNREMSGWGNVRITISICAVAYIISPTFLLKLSSDRLSCLILILFSLINPI